MTDCLQKAINDLVPKSLDDIVRVNRDRYSLRLFSENDMASFVPMVESMTEPKPVRGIIDDWRIICLQVVDQKLYFLTGILRERRVSYMTSDVRSVDIENNLVLTKNSLYEIGSKGEGEPDFHGLLHICAVFHAWGTGPYLGAPHIFY